MIDLNSLLNNQGTDTSGQTGVMPINTAPQNNRLADLAQLFLAGQQANPPQDTGPKMIMAGGRALGRDVSQPSRFQNAMGGLSGLATGYLQAQQMQKRNQFFKSVNDIMGSNSPTEDKKNNILQLIMQHGGQDYGLGIKDVLVKELGQPKMPVYKTDANGNLVQVGTVEKGSKILPQGSEMLSKFKQDEQGNYIVPEGMEVMGFDQKGQPMIRKKQSTPQERETAKAEGQVMAQTLKQKAQAKSDFIVAKNKLRTTMAAFKAMGETGGTGRIGGMLNVVGGVTGLNPYTQAYKGQLVEAAAALAKLAAPSARIGQEIIAMFKQTLPSVVATTPEAINQIRFSLQNAFATALGRAGQEYTSEIDDMITQMVSDIVDVKPMRTEDLKRFPPSQTSQNKVGKYTLIQ